MHNINWEEKKETLIQLLITENKSFEEVGRLFNMSGKGIRKVCDRLRIPIPKRRILNSSETFGKGTRRVQYIKCLNCGKEIPRATTYERKFCCKKCEGSYKKKMGYQRIIEGNPEIMKTTFSLKRYKDIILKEQNNRCAICGMTPFWRDRPLVFILDHIDGHAANNKRDNLRLVCPNCDSQLDTYKSKNKNSDRVYYHFHQRR